MPLLLSCEHGGYRVPDKYRRLFRGSASVLKSHRGYDPGALEFARRAARELAAPLAACEVTRLLIEMNRSLHHRQLFSEFSRNLPGDEKRALIEEYYRPHHAAVRSMIDEALQNAAASEPVVHLGVHSFTPVLHGQTRRADIGLLYDPQRRGEREFCRRWQALLRQAARAEEIPLLVRCNYPYRGAADGLTTQLRREHPAARYLGIELEINQRYPQGRRADWRRLQRVLLETLTNSLHR